MRVNTPLNEDQVFRQLKSIIVEALRIDPEMITMQSNILKDFDAESIDLVDIRFRIEEAFGFKVDQEEFIRGLGEGLDEKDIVEHITVTRVVNYIMNQLTRRART